MLAEAAEWLLQAEDAFKAADAMYQTRRYLHAIFMCQLAIEKGLKAVVVARTGRLAPKTHNLTYLAELGQVQLTEEQREFIAILDAAGTTTRYPWVCFESTRGCGVSRSIRVTPSLQILSVPTGFQENPVTPPLQMRPYPDPATRRGCDMTKVVVREPRRYQGRYPCSGLLPRATAWRWPAPGR